MSAQHRVFVSYSRSDFYFAEQLAVALRRRCLEVWFDVHELAMGSDWSAAIDEGIAECDTFLLVASRAALASPYVQSERERAAELGRPCVTVLPARLNPLTLPALPTYDLTSSFKRGVDQLASDLAAGSQQGRRPRLRLPYSLGVCVVAFALALAEVFAVALGAEFAKKVIGHKAVGVQRAGPALAAAGTMFALAVGWPAYALWAFIVRRVTWWHLRVCLFVLPLVAVLAYSSLDLVAGYLTTDPIVAALGGVAQGNVGDAPGLLACGVIVMSIVAAIVTSFSPGVCRHLCTGTAPPRVRRRHIGPLPRPVDSIDAAHTYRLFAADDDASVREEIQRALAHAGISEIADGEEGDREIFVLTDRTPAEWLTWDNLQNPLAVVATSISLPVRGVLERFQWVDYRARRRRTLVALGRDLTTEASSVALTYPAPDIPERLQAVRLPWWVRVTEWTLYSMAVLATVVAAYPVERWAFTDHAADLWPPVLCIAVAPVLMIAGVWVRRRRITLLLLVLVVSLCWVAMVACGLDTTLWAMFPSYDRGTSSTLTLGYPAVSAAIIGLSWRTLRRWLPRRFRTGKPAAPTLGHAHGSWPWRVIVVPVLVGASAAAGISPPEQSIAAPATASAEVCRDQAGIEAVTQPYLPADAAVQSAAPGSAYSTAFAHRIQVKISLVRDLGRYEPAGAWGAGIAKRLMDAFDRTVRADQAVLRHEISAPKWDREYDDLIVVMSDVVAPIC